MRAEGAASTPGLHCDDELDLLWVVRVMMMEGSKTYLSTRKADSNNA